MSVQPSNPFAVSAAPGTGVINSSCGRGGDLIVSEMHGKYYLGCYYNAIYSFNVTAVTLPVIAATLASKFSLYNPPASTKNLELIEVDVGVVLATTVVDVVGIYWQAPTLASLATLTTIGVYGTNWFSGFLGAGAGAGNPYSALTHSGTPVRIDIISTFGAVTSTADNPIHKDYDGKIIVPVGHVISVAMSTTVGTTSGTDVGIKWMEVPTT